ncbi:hypothetical protein AVEN_255580-1 [Araneus ventricosus]|uniref:Uncharacterized protein n=1 Tax=Araneus ventricosus TaxID=182803 RepID=A0A4Y2KSB1_ARAVE|nr:hypothetical protein AVEN_255580-1 [Araneus ventricosus]
MPARPSLTASLLPGGLNSMCLNVVELAPETVNQTVLLYLKEEGSSVASKKATPTIRHITDRPAHAGNRNDGTTNPLSR